jgi:CheY-like chemotaxis protein
MADSAGCLLVVEDDAQTREIICHALAARIRDRWPDISVVAISGRVDKPDVEEFHFDAFLYKPLRIQSLRDTVAQMLARKG